MYVTTNRGFCVAEIVYIFSSGVIYDAVITDVCLSCGLKNQFSTLIAQEATKIPTVPKKYR